MIQIYAKNPLYSTTLLETLREFKVSPYKADSGPLSVLIICASQEETNEILSRPLSCSVILLGTHHEDADLEIHLPCSLDELKSHIKRLLHKQETAPDFENNDFLFEGSKRLLTCKTNQTQIRLTEKETHMIIYLIKSLPESVSKSDLLTEVWNYRADSETHTVETHIYALRQKIGEKFADSFIKNTPDGYGLVQNS